MNAWCAIIESKANEKIPEICERAREIAGVDVIKARDVDHAARSSDPEIRTRAALDSESESEDSEHEDDRDDENHGDVGDVGDVDSAEDGDTRDNGDNHYTSSSELSEIEPESDHGPEYESDNREIQIKQEKVDRGTKSRSRVRK